MLQEYIMLRVVGCDERAVVFVVLESGFLGVAWFFFFNDTATSEIYTV